MPAVFYVCVKPYIFPGLFLGCITEEEVSKWCVVHTVNIRIEHVWLCIEVDRSKYAVLSNEDILSFVECFHTLCRIGGSFCCIDSCILVRVGVLSVVVSAVCVPHIQE